MRSGAKGARSGSREEDGPLVERALEGDCVAVEALVRKYLGPAFSVALSVLANPHDAEEAAQDAMVSVVHHLADCREPAKFGAWALAIARNRALNAVESRRVRRADPIEDHVLSASSPDPADASMRLELGERLSAALDRLTASQREVVLLHDLEGWQHGEIATALGMSEVMSRQVLFQARRVLRATLGQEREGGSHG